MKRVAPRRSKRIGRRAVWHRHDIPEIEVKLVVGLTAIRPEATRPNAGQRLPRQRGVSVDRLSIVELHVADPIDVHGSAPTMRCGAGVHRVTRRAVPAVGRDVNEGAGGVAEALETEREHRDGARDEAWETAKGRRFTHVRLNELPQREARRQLHVHRVLPRRHLVEVARQRVRMTRVVVENAARQKHLAQRSLQAQPVDDPQRKTIALTHGCHPHPQSHALGLT
jgi:hypothetical protein